MGDVYQHGIRLHVWIGTREEIRDDIRRKFPVEAQHDIATPEQLARLRILLLDAGITVSSDADADADVMGAMEILKIFAEDEHWCEPRLFKFRSGAMELEVDEFWHISKSMLLGILTQPWWKRVWVVQEVVLSTPAEATLLHISHHELPLSSCDNFPAYTYKHSLSCCRDSYSLSWGIARFEGYFEDVLENSMSHLLRCHKNETLDMGVAYDSFSSRHAADPHDYIYGFLGLMKSFPSGLEADYRRPISSLYLAATRALFRAEGSIEYLKAAVGVDADNQHHLPSWCIDWSKWKRSPHPPKLFNAARKWSQPIPSPARVFVSGSSGAERGSAKTRVAGEGIQRLYYDENSLLLDATAGDRITCVSFVIKETTIDPVDRMVKWMRAIGHRDLKDDITTILRVLARDHFRDYIVDGPLERISPEYMELFKEWKDFVSSNKRRPDNAQPQLSGVDLHMHNRQCLFFTRHGRLGAGSPTTRVGDCVFVAKRSDCPLVLRPLSDSSFEDRQQDFPSYQYVSQCYVDGIMDGEAVDADTEWQTIRLC